MKTLNLKTIGLLGLLGSSLLLTGCGGGGGGSSAPTNMLPESARYFDSDGNGVVTRSELNSEWSNAEDSVKAELQNAANEFGINVSNLAVTIDAGNKTDTSFAPWVTDTGASQAWSEGWTGAGQTIAIVDRFTPSSGDKRLNWATVEVTATVEGQLVEAKVKGQLEYNNSRTVTHGQAVAAIAGGVNTLQVDVTIEKARLNSNNMLGRTVDGVTIPVKGTTIATESIRIPGVAIGANIVTYDHNGFADLSQAINSARDSDADVINMSFSRHEQKATVIGNIDPSIDFLKDHQVAVTSAGNTSDETQIDSGISRIELDQLIVAGSFNTSHKGINAYSGINGLNYLAARDDAGLLLADNIGGTSFSAPRISGSAAIVGQKFPTLSGAGVVSALMDNADSSTIGGHATPVLNLNAALAP